MRKLRVRFVYIHANCLIIGLHYHSGLEELVFHPASLSAASSEHQPSAMCLVCSLGELLLCPLLTEGLQRNKPLSKKV